MASTMSVVVVAAVGTVVLCIAPGVATAGEETYVVQVAAALTKITKKAPSIHIRNEPDYIHSKDVRCGCYCD